MTEKAAILVMGVGNPYRCDDAAGLIVAQALQERLDDRVRVIQVQGNPGLWLEAWADVEGLVIVDAVEAGGPPGSWLRWDVSTGRLPAQLGSPSTHGWSVAEALELARVLGQLPVWVVVYGIVGQSYAMGTTLSSAVAAVIPQVVEAVIEEVQQKLRQGDTEIGA